MAGELMRPSDLDADSSAARIGHWQFIFVLLCPKWITTWCIRPQRLATVCLLFSPNLIFFGGLVIAPISSVSKLSSLSTNVINFLLKSGTILMKKYFLFQAILIALTMIYQSNLNKISKINNFLSCFHHAESRFQLVNHAIKFHGMWFYCKIK